MKTKALSAILSGMVLASTMVASAADPARLDDEKAIRALLDSFARSFAKGDAPAIVAMFTEQGEAVDAEGNAIRGREALLAHYSGRFAASPGEKIETTVELVHFLAPEVARQDGRSKLIPAEAGPHSSSRYTATYLKREGRWSIASLRELEDTTIGHHDRLKELEWLVGDWVEETGDVVITNAIAWSEDENFLIRAFQVHVAGKPDLKGTQRIGWDPLTKQIKSWVFDSRGGYGDGHWTRDGDRWIIKAVGVRPDGQVTSATQVLTRLKKDRLLWTSNDRTLGGEATDESLEYVMVRKPPEPK